MIEPEPPMGWVFFEVALVLAIAFVIVWWTIPRKPRPKDGEGEPADGDRSPRN
jgi:hypothetical protein